MSVFMPSRAYSQSIQPTPPSIGTVEQNSGFVDDNGKPLSRSEYEAIQNKNTGIQWQNIGLLIGILFILGIVTVIIIFFIKKSKKPKNIPMQNNPENNMSNQQQLPNEASQNSAETINNQSNKNNQT